MGSSRDDTIYVYTSTKKLTFELLLTDIKQELADEKFTGRVHGRSDTYRDGCRGQLCKYRERTRKREARARSARQVLPAGVVPETRPREEQKWDHLLAAVLRQMDSIRTQKDTGRQALLGRLSEESMRRYLQLMKPRVYPALDAIPRQVQVKNELAV